MTEELTGTTKMRVGRPDLIQEETDLRIPNTVYEKTTSGQITDGIMNNNMKIILLQGAHDLTPSTFTDLKVDGLYDDTGTATFKNNTLNAGETTATLDDTNIIIKRVTAVTEHATFNITGVTGGTKKYCQLYVNPIDMEDGCEIYYDLISKDAEVESGIEINKVHEITSFTATTTKLNNGKIKIYLKNENAEPTSGYPSINSYAIKFWEEN